jgi:hypothetical protein
VRYDAVNAMLLKEFLKEHKKVEEQQAYDYAAKERLRRNGGAAYYASRRAGIANPEGGRPA